MVSERVIWIHVLKLIRFLLDLFSNCFFWLINLRKGKRIDPVTNPVLLQPAFSLAEQIRKKQIKSVEVVEAYISRIKEIQPILNVLAEERFEKALEEAKEADELIQSQKYTEQELEKLYPYLGVPFTNKESLAVKGMLNTGGTIKNKGNRAPEDADTVALMKKAGAISLAVTNVPELCMWWETNNYIYGKTCNPYDSRRIVGGSSGGEGALLAAGGSVIGIGSDIGGSIRLPAFFNGIFGHKPTPGIVSNKEQVPRTSDLYDKFLVTGPMCRYAKDLLPMFKVLAGSNVSKLNLDKKVDISQLKIYYMEESGDILSSPVCPEMKSALRKVVQYFEEAYGIKPQKVNFKEMSRAGAIWSLNMASIPGPQFITHMLEKDETLNEKLEVLKWIVGSSKYTLPCILFVLYNKYVEKSSVKAQTKYVNMANKLRNKIEEMLGDDGIFLYPSQPEPAIYHHQTYFKGTQFGYTAIFNILGLPVTQCPLGLSSNGLPLGVQVVAGSEKDRLTIATAFELEKAFGGWKNPNL